MNTKFSMMACAAIAAGAMIASAQAQSTDTAPVTKPVPPGADKSVRVGDTNRLPPWALGPVRPGMTNLVPPGADKSLRIGDTNWLPPWALGPVRPGMTNPVPPAPVPPLPVNPPPRFEQVPPQNPNIPQQPIAPQQPLPIARPAPAIAPAGRSK